MKDELRLYQLEEAVRGLQHRVATLEKEVRELQEEPVCDFQY